MMRQAGLLTTLRILLGGAALMSLYLVSTRSYVLFHTLAELFTIAVATSIFIIAWNARRMYENASLLLLGVALLCVSIIDVFHIVTYKGMAIIPGITANLPTQLWIALRGVETLSFFAVPLVIGRTLHPNRLLLGYGVIAALLLGSIFAYPVFPVCYVDRPGGGLTSFKIIVEYIYAALLTATLFLLWWRRNAFEDKVLRCLLLATACNIFSGLAFTSYVSVYGPANALGHLFRIVSFYFIYQAIVVTALQRPYELLFRELKLREEALQQAQHAQEEMTQFIVHDLRSPLTSIFAGIDTLQRALPIKLPETHRQLLEATTISCSWMLTLINSLLDASRLESGKMTLHPQAVTVPELFTAATTQLRAWAELNGMTIVSECSPEVTHVYADSELTLRVLVNLLSNAIKWSPSASIIHVTAKPNPTGFIAFSVTDQGPGVQPEWAQKVFERFGQVEARRAGAGGGSGLGLNFCRLAVEAQGGSISLESRDGAGTTVTFTLPLPPPLSGA